MVDCITLGIKKCTLWTFLTRWTWRCILILANRTNFTLVFVCFVDILKCTSCTIFTSLCVWSTSARAVTSTLVWTRCASVSGKSIATSTASVCNTRTTNSFEIPSSTARYTRVRGSCTSVRGCSSSIRDGRATRFTSVGCVIINVELNKWSGERNKKQNQYLLLQKNKRDLNKIKECCTLFVSHVSVVHVLVLEHVLHVASATAGQPASHPLAASPSVSN